MQRNKLRPNLKMNIDRQVGGNIGQIKKAKKRKYLRDRERKGEKSMANFSSSPSPYRMKRHDTLLVCTEVRHRLHIHSPLLDRSKKFTEATNIAREICNSEQNR